LLSRPAVQGKRLGQLEGKLEISSALAEQPGTEPEPLPK
jgi:hypothetical protein